MSLEHEESLGPKRIVKLLLSLFICWHFFAIFTAVTAASTSMLHPAPLPAVQLARINYWYQHLLFLHNAYRFYVPDPGPVQTLWFHLEYEGPHGRKIAYWYEVPRRESFFWRMSYQRHCSVTMLVQMMGPDPLDQNKLHPTSETLLSSYVRHVAHRFPRHPKVADAGPLKRVEIYLVSRTTYPTGYDIQRNLTLDDPRWYRPVYYASYTPEGEKLPLEPSKQILRETLPNLLQGLQGTEFFSALFPVTAEFLLYDYRFRIEMGVDSRTALQQLDPPNPMQHLLRIVPEVLDIAEKEPIGSTTYVQLVQTMHNLCGSRRGYRLLEDDMLPLGIRPRVQEPVTLLGTKPPATKPNGAQPGIDPSSTQPPKDLSKPPAGK